MGLSLCFGSFLLIIYKRIRDRTLANQIPAYYYIIQHKMKVVKYPNNSPYWSVSNEKEAKEVPASETLRACTSFDYFICNIPVVICTLGLIFRF